MTHEEFLKALKAEKSFLKWLFKSKKKTRVKVKRTHKKALRIFGGTFLQNRKRLLLHRRSRG